MDSKTASIARFIFAKIRSQLSRAYALRLLSSVQSVVNRYKGYTPQYLFLTEQYHHELDSYLKTTPNTELDPQKLFQLLECLCIVAETNVRKTCELSEKGLGEYFELVNRADRVPPRVCIKGFHNQKIFDITPRIRSDYAAFLQDFADNSAISNIVKNAGVYQEPDIPYASKFGHYKNPRLDQNSVQRYEAPTFFKRILTHFTHHPYSDQAWLSCWDRKFQASGESKQLTSAYKSTLVIPLSLYHAELIPKFRREFMDNKIDAEAHVFGALCMDHVKSGFFSKKDQAVGKMYANLVTVSLVHYLIYIERSGVVKKAMKELAKISPAHFSSLINGKPMTEVFAGSA